MELKNQPLVTVYIPTYNRIELLKRAVKSVQDQTYRNLEIIIVDDCSTDVTHEYLAQLAKEDSRVRYFLKEKNSGACVSRNIAIENATGEFVTGLDDDDYFLNNRISNFVKQIDNEAIFIFDNPQFLKNKQGKVEKTNTFMKRRIINSNDILNYNYVGNQIFIKTIIMREMGGFDVKLTMWQDFEFWYRILKLKNAKAKRIDGYTYVVDISHDYERISKFNYDKALITYNYFKEKHSLDKWGEKVLYSHLYNYNSRLIDIRFLLKKLVFHFNFYDLKKILLKIFNLV